MRVTRDWISPAKPPRIYIDFVSTSNVIAWAWVAGGGTPIINISKIY